MTANELRVGCSFQLENSVLGGGIATIKNKYDLDVAFDLLESNLIKPIPLTEEWLLKFGFKAWDNKETIYTLERDIDEYNNTCFRFWFQSDKLIFDYIQNEVHPTESVFDDKNIIRLDIQHVHQLQNLYFALTNEELTFKSE